MPSQYNNEIINIYVNVNEKNYESTKSENNNDHFKLPDVNAHKNQGRDFVYDDEENTAQNIVDDEDIVPLQVGTAIR